MYDEHERTAARASAAILAGACRSHKADCCCALCVAWLMSRRIGADNAAWMPGILDDEPKRRQHG